MVPGLKFAVVREDASVEAALITRSNAQSILTVASGGCTALTLKRQFPLLRVAAFDINPVQLAHVKRKQQAVLDADTTVLNVNTDRADGLNQCGAFEGLFRILRTTLTEFVAAPDGWAGFFGGAPLDEYCFTSAYWPAAFECAFNEPLLHAMFGPAATQHAPRGSYPAYFQRAFEQGLRRPDAQTNPFLQHVLLGKYLEPLPYMTAQRVLDIELIEGTLADVPDLGRFDVVSISNILDWAADDLARQWSYLMAQLRPGALLLIRQLNNTRPLELLFPNFTFDGAWGAALLATDRSLFYQRIIVGKRA